jgi:hypothetical protein
MLMECPKCHTRQPEGQAACGACGIVFAKWEARRRALAETEPARLPVDPAPPSELATRPPRAEASAEFMRGCRWGLCLLGIGFAVPLLKASVMFGTSVVWPWDLFGSASDVEQAAAMAMLSGGTHLAAWSSVPVGLLLLTPALQRFCPWPLGARLSSLAGVSALFLMLVALSAENEILGLFFAPPTTGAGVIMFAGALSAIVLSTTNRSWHGERLSGGQRALLGTAGVALGLTACGFALGSAGPWAAWAMLLLYLAAAAQACLGIYQACKGEISADTAVAMSRLATGLLVWGVVAVGIAQQTNDDPFYGWVVQGGGGSFHTLSGLLKGFALYYGIGSISMAGLHGTFRRGGIET